MNENMTVAEMLQQLNSLIATNPRVLDYLVCDKSGVKITPMQPLFFTFGI